MVVRIKTGKRVKGILSYNEAKVQRGQAECILATGFSTDVDELSFSQKLRRFTRLTERNQKITTNAVHISLNFPPEEKLSTERLREIATDYMDKIGFGHQPYLVYRHTDAHHPHIHIVTTSIRSSGKAIYMHNIAKRKSEPARKDIEQQYGLIVAESRKRLNPHEPVPVQVTTAKYGKTATKQTISNIVREVVDNYKYTSLEELNAILKLYNITAYRGAVDSTQYKTGGLTYSITDKDGYRIGNAIKASSIYTSPTLQKLNKNFEKNKIRRIPYKKYIQAKVDAVASRAGNIETLISQLEQKNIHTHFERSSRGDITGILFIDPFNRTIFTADDLGHSVDTLFAGVRTHRTQTTAPKTGASATPSAPDITDQLHLNISIDLIKNILNTEKGGPDLDPALTRKRRKKRRPGTR